MIVVVADTSPLNYLVQIEKAHVLPSLYDASRCPPPSSRNSATQGRFPRFSAGSVPLAARWIVRAAAFEVDRALSRLDPGEREAIQLAKQERADLLLMDEKLGVRIARDQGLAVTGTLGGTCCRLPDEVSSTSMRR